MKTNPKLLIRLFFSTLLLSAFTFGGGYVIVSLMKKKFVDKYHWLTDSEMLDLAAIAQSAPGPIAVNGAVAVGYKLSGIIGIIVCAFATIIPPFVIISVISLFYDAFRSNHIISLLLEGMQAGVGAVIASVAYDMSFAVVKNRDTVSEILLIAAFILCIIGVNAIWIILACGSLGAVRTLYSKRRRENASS